MPQRAEPAQHGRDDAPRQGAVAIRQRGESWMRLLAVDLLVERASAAQHSVDDVGGDAAGGEAGDFGLRGKTGTRHRISIPRHLMASWIWPSRTWPSRHSADAIRSCGSERIFITIGCDDREVKRFDASVVVTSGPILTFASLCGRLSCE